jgi:hypothetical protein
MKRLLASLFARSRRIVGIEVKIVALALTVEKGFLIELDSLAIRSKCSMSEVIDRSVHLYAKVLAQAEQGKVPKYVFPD